MKNAAPTLIALLVAVIALAVALFRSPEPALHAQAPHPVASGEEGVLGQRVASLEAEVARLGGEIALLRSSSPGARETVVSDGGDSAAVGARIADLERQLNELKTTRKTASSKLDELLREARAQAEGGEKGIEEWTRTAQNGAATEEELLAALRKLRGAELPDGTDARLGVLPEMIRLAENSQDERARADVWRQLSGVTDPSLLQPLLHALQNDPSPEAREEAAETLGDFMPDPAVRNALQFAAENDASPDVRAQCYESLGSGRR
jgi:HEAT repeat protein